MASYFLSIGTGKVHKLTCPYKVRMNIENYKEFSSLEEIKHSTEKHVTRCKHCMRDEDDSWKRVFDVQEL